MLWAVFVLGVVAAAALSLSVFWGALFRTAEAVSALMRGRRDDLPPGGDNVLP